MRTEVNESRVLGREPEVLDAIFQQEAAEDTVRRSRHSESPAVTKALRVALLTGGQDPHYAYGLATALVSAGVGVDLIGGNSVDGSGMQNRPGIRFLNLYGGNEHAGIYAKAQRLAGSYGRIMRYVASTDARILHILWNNRLDLVDRTLLMSYYKQFEKKVVLTAHNVNAARRDGKDSWLNRYTLGRQYRMADQIFVHTEKMKSELQEQFRVSEHSITTIPYGLNNAVPDTDLTPSEARKKLGIRDDEKVILFFGAIKTYKGLEYLVPAFQQLATERGCYRLIIAGERKKGCEDYFDKIRAMIACDPSQSDVLQKIEFIPDQETEIYFKAADVAALPYTEIFQSGILFLALSFGVPVIATDVGSFRDDVVDGETGFICKACDADDLAATLRRYFESELFRHLPEKRVQIRDFARSRHSWDVVGAVTQDVYLRLTAS